MTVGRRLGRTLGFPTANIELSAGNGAADGVWLARAEGVTADGERFRYWALVNVGTAPTVAEGGRRKAEAWLFDFEGDLYGCELRLELLRCLRPERRFDALEDLRRAMEEDRKNALNIIQEDELTL